MTKRILPFALILSIMASSADAGFNVSTFEDVGLSTPNSYFNATPNLTDPTYNTSTTVNGQFVSGGNAINNSYSYSYDANNPSYSYGTWTGWSISNQTNVTYVNQATTPDYGFEYTSVTGSGAGGSSTYAVANTSGDGTTPYSIVNFAPGSSPISLQITNTAYDYFSMIHGDSFATPYTAGNYLLLTIDGHAGLNGTGADLGQIQYYLANYLGSDPSRYYIVTTWQTLDLTSLQGASSLVFGLQSNKMNDYGVSTPFEFAMDNLTTFTASVPEPSSLLMCLIGMGIGSLVLRRVRPPSPPLI